MPQLIPIGAAALAFFATPVGGILLSVGLSGASFLLSSALSSGQSAATTLDAGVQQTVQDSIYPERLIYGRAFVGGRVFFYECKPPNLYIGLEIASHEIDAIEEVWINGVKTSFDNTGAASSVNMVNGSTPYCHIWERRGVPGQAIDGILSANFPELSSTFRQQGHACVVLQCYYGADATDHNKYWGSGFPQVLFLVRGLKVFNPNDATQSVASPSTWQWSNIASLCQAHYLTYSKGMARNWSAIDMPSLQAAALHDIEGVARADGTIETRYQVNGIVDPNTEPATILQSMLTANLGDLIWSDGVYVFLSGRPRTPTWTLTDDTARGPMEVRATRDRASLINLVRTTFVSLDREYQTVNGPILNNTTYATADGEAHEVTIQLPFTTSQSCAQRIAKATMERSRHGKNITRRESIDALRLDGADIVNIQVDFMSVLGGVFKVNSTTLDHETLEFAIEAEEYSPSIYDWTVAEEQAFTIIPAVLAGTN